MALSMSEIQRMTDDDLYEMLSQFFPVVGPVVESTRSVYQSMLFNKLTEVGDAGFRGGVAMDFREPPVVPATTENLGVAKASADDQIKPSPKPHLFKRWNEEEDDMFSSQYSPASSNIRSRARTYDEIPPEHYLKTLPQTVSKQGSGMKKVILLAIVFVLTGVMIFIMNQKQDPYQNIESEANSMAGDV